MSGEKIKCKKCKKEKDTESFMSGKRKCVNCLECRLKKISYRKCIFQGCTKEGTFGKKNEKELYCKKHSRTDDIDVRNKKCLICGKIATFGIPGAKPTYCVRHKLENYIDVRSKKCEFPDCTKQPTFGLSNHKPTRCSKHKLENYTNVKDKKCEFPDCTKQPIFGILGSKPQWCFDHKTGNHVDVKNKKCLYENCTKNPTFGLPGSKRIYCYKHKLDGKHVNLVHKLCEKCDKIASFGLPGSKAQRCFRHKLKNYVNLLNKKCEFPDCTKQPRFGNSESKPTFCSEHKLKGQVDLVHKKCIFENCLFRAHYSFPSYSPEYCKIHKKDNMVLNPTKYKTENIKTCEYCQIKVHYSENFCPNCKEYISAGVTVKRKQKEETIKVLLEKENIEFKHDLIVKDGCSKKRPDFIIQTNFGIIILEVDEFQHRKNYTEECECTRMKQLYMDAGEKNLLFIRYNPDNYKPISGKPENNFERQNYLIKFLKEQIEKEEFENLSAVYLYYDNFSKEKLEWLKIDPYN